MVLGPLSISLLGTVFLLCTVALPKQETDKATMFANSSSSLLFSARSEWAPEPWGLQGWAEELLPSEGTPTTISYATGLV
jgi:hypothetical protein